MSAILLSLLLVSSVVVGIEGKEGDLRGLKRKPATGSWEKDVFTDDKDKEYISEPVVQAAEARTFAAAPSDVIQKFKSRHALKEDEGLPLQEITSSNTFQADGRMYSLDDLTPVNVFTKDATYSADGESATLPKVRTFTKSDGDTTMLVTQGDGEDEMRAIEIVHNDGSVTFLEEVTEGVVATVRPEARDRDMLNKFVMGHLENDNENSSDDAENGRIRTRKLFKSEPVEGRMLQAGCSAFRVLEVAIAYESSFCSQLGGAANANAAVEQIVSRASALYQANFCTRIVMSHMEGFCDTNSDPYRAAVELNNSGCNGGGLLGSFADFWNRNRGTIRRDAAHLFSGTGLECTNGSCVIGCARTPSLCSSSSSYGVNFMTFNRDPQLRSNLFAHELGHNAGSGHDATTSSFQFIMERRINGGANGFSQQSKDAITRYLDSRSCISVEQVTDTTPPPPTPPAPTPPAPTPLAPTPPAPTPSPTPPAPTPPAPTPPAPTPTTATSPSDAPCGCSACTPSVLASVANGYRCVDRINWLIRFQGRDQLDACAAVGEAYPSVCGQGCNPNQCGSTEPEDNGDGDSPGGTILSRFDSSCMDVNVGNIGNGNVRSSACFGGDDQVWIYEASTQRIKTAFNTDFCLQWNLANNNLDVSRCNSDSNQQWISDGSSIKSQRNANACIDLNTRNGNYYMNNCHGRDDQQFDVPSGFF